MTLNDVEVCDALLENLRSLTTMLRRASETRWLDTFSRSGRAGGREPPGKASGADGQPPGAVESPQVRARRQAERVEREIPGLLPLWRTVAAHGRALLAGAISLDQRDRLLSHAAALEDLSCRWRASRLLCAVDLAGIYPPDWRPGWEPATVKRVEEVEVAPDDPLATSGDKLMDPLGRSMLGIVSRESIQKYIFISGRDFTGLEYTPAELTELSSRAFAGYGKKRMPPLRWTGTARLPPESLRAGRVAWVCILRFPGARMCTIRATVNGKVTIRPDPVFDTTLVPAGSSGRVRSFHTFDLSILKPENTIELFALGSKRGTEAPPAAFDAVSIGSSEMPPGSTTPR
ncbi:MAG: hypothetical protein HY815_26850 [Candidatus Riflebacteria bacterium]|nr:hypothetical protein [Candidatus Riflebacteria bacterium]